MSASRDYHDYVFKDGRLVGEFDAMYQNSDEVPWHQDESAFAFFSDITLTILKSVQAPRILELGCGLGYFTRRIQQACESAEIFGADISAKAIEDARRLHPGIEFFPVDILQPDSVAEALRRMQGPVDCMLSKEVLWYVTDHIADYVAGVKQLIGERGCLYVSQSFTEVEKYFGQDVFP